MSALQRAPGRSGAQAAQTHVACQRCRPHAAAAASACGGVNFCGPCCWPGLAAAAAYGDVCALLDIACPNAVLEGVLMR